jgi:hypothetical protein
MNSRQRSGFSFRRPLPTISESPTSGQPSNSPTNPQNPSGSGSSYSTTFGKASSTFQKLSRPSGINGVPSLPSLKPANVKPRTSKTSQKHVALPTTAQDAPLPSILEALDLSVPSPTEGPTEDGEEFSSEEAHDGFAEERARRSRKARQRENEGGRTDDAVWKRTIGEQLTPEQRDDNGYQRLTAYYCCEEFKMSLLSGFLKREHAVSPRFSLVVRLVVPNSDACLDYMTTLSMLSIIYLFFLDINRASTFAPALLTKQPKRNSFFPS